MISSCHVAAYSIRERRPSAYDFCVIRVRRTSGWFVIVTRGAVLSDAWVRSGPCTRSLAYSRAFKYPLDSVAMALDPTIMRAFRSEERRVGKEGRGWS